MKNRKISSPQKHRAVAIILFWPGHKFLITAKNTHVGQSKTQFETLSQNMTVIVKRDHNEVWREAEQILTAAEQKPLTLQYVLFFERSPMFGGEKTIAVEFTHGDFARSIIHTCTHGAPWIKSLSSTRREQVMEVYKAFRQNHEILITQGNHK